MWRGLIFEVEPSKQPRILRRKYWWRLLLCSVPHQGPKITPKPKNRTNHTKEFSEQFEGTTEWTKGFEANCTRKFTQKFGKILSHKFFGVPCLFLVPDQTLLCTCPGSKRSDLSDLPNANAKWQHSLLIPALWEPLDRKSQLDTSYWHAAPYIAWPHSLSASKSQHCQSQRLQAQTQCLCLKWRAPI